MRNAPPWNSFHHCHSVGYKPGTHIPADFYVGTLPTKSQSIHKRDARNILAHFSQKQESLQDFSSAVWFRRTSPTSRPPSGYYYRFRKPIERIISLSIFKTTGVQQKQESLQDFHYRFRKPIERIIGGLIQQKIIQESFTRNDIYKSCEIIHFNAILQRAPRHHHSNIHTSITYTQSFAIKKNVKDKNKDGHEI